jgi:nucleotide-binding universal stress UspA family protein
MYKKVLVPLDGSPFSQCSLEQLRTVARKDDVCEFIILRVVEPLADDDRSALVDLAAEQIPKIEEAKNSIARDYVSVLAKRLADEGIHARAEIAHGKAAEEIIKYAEKNKCDLIIMSTHGRSGNSRWTIGSVADRVSNHSPVPVLLVSPRECRTSAGF